MNDNIWPYQESKSKFCLVNSINEGFYLIYISNPNRELILYNLKNFNINTIIKTGHNSKITDVRHFKDIKNKIDLILSTSLYGQIKLWNLRNCECLLNIENIYKHSSIYMYSSCFLENNNFIYIITSNFAWRSGPFKVFDLNGKLIKEINDSNDETIYIENYYDNKLSTNFILACNTGFIKSYDFKNNKLFKKYNVNDQRSLYKDFTFYTKGEITKLIGSNLSGFIAMWNIHTGELLVKFVIYELKYSLHGICLLNDEILIVGFNNSLNIINISQKKIIKKLNEHQNGPTIIEKISHPKYGDCLLSGCNSKIILWKYKDLNFDLKKIIKNEYSE